MKTTNEVVKSTAYIWAVPKSEWLLKKEVEENDGIIEGICPFRYEITDDNSDYRSSAVLVHEFDIAGVVPAGIDLVLKAVETLRGKIAEIQAEADKEVAELEKQIKNLALIEYKPQPEVIEVTAEPRRAGDFSEEDDDPSF